MGLLSFLKRGEADDGGTGAPSAKQAAAKSAQTSKAKAGAGRGAADTVDDVQQLRLRARHRLIGAAVLVAVAIIVFPLLFETQPRPIPVDLPIDIPKKDGVAPLNVPAGAAATAGTGTGTGTPVAQADRAAESSSGRGVITETPEQVAGDRTVPPPEALRDAPADPVVERPADPAVRTDVKPEAKARMAEPAHVDPRPRPAEPKVARADVKPEPRPETKPDNKPATPDRRSAATPGTGNESARVQALLDGQAAERRAAEAAERKTADPAPGSSRFVVQVGAYADAKAAQDARAKVERMGLKTYTQAVETADGKRIRVRVGPFGSRDEADKVAAKIRGGGLSSAVLTL